MEELKEVTIATFEKMEKYNSSIILTESDQNSKRVKILCKEPYAQELYDMMNAFADETGVPIGASKDLTVGQLYNVKATRVSFNDQLIHAQEVNSKVEIMIPFKEFSRSIDDLAKGHEIMFNVLILKADSHGGYTGSEKKCIHINFKQELFDLSENNKWFEIKITKLIKGGYVATYKDTVDCFIPGSHAGANVIRDFSKLLGKTMNVMVDNYDKSNDLFILSYKKYIKKSMPIMVSDLKFGPEIVGHLTTKPLDFGIFVEFDDYFTGLIHSSEFEDYDEVKSTLRAGDPINFFIKNVTNKGKEYRVVLTLDEESIDPVKRQWTEFRDKVEGTKVDYKIDYTDSTMTLNIDGNEHVVSMKKRDMEKNLELFPKVLISKVDPINQRLKFEFTV
jgi:ribosomal protein S1